MWLVPMSEVRLSQCLQTASRWVSPNKHFTATGYVHIRNLQINARLKGPLWSHMIIPSYPTSAQSHYKGLSLPYYHDPECFPNLETLIIINYWKMTIQFMYVTALCKDILLVNVVQRQWQMTNSRSYNVIVICSGSNCDKPKGFCSLNVLSAE